MDLVKKNYDVVILLLATAILSANAAWLVFKISSGTDSISAVTVAPQQKNTFQPPDLQAIEAAKLAATQPVRWVSTADKTGAKGSLFVSRQYLLKDDTLIDPIEGDENLHAPITNAWLMANNLDLADASIKDKDADSDGFTNLEEFLAGTNPKASDSSPPVLNKLRLVQFTSKQFPLVFKGDASGAGTSFLINLKTEKGRSRTLTAEMGEQIELPDGAAPYKITNYEKIERPDPRGVVINESVLTLENVATGEKIPLVFNRPANDPTSQGIFRNLINGSEFTLKKGDDFTIPPDGVTNFKLIDISSTSAQIQDLATGQIYPVATMDGPRP
jgi:hypothetical protein